MKKLFFVIAALAVILPSAAQQTIKSENVSRFMAVTATGNISLEMIPAQYNAIDVVLHDSDITKFKWGVSDGVLSFTLKPSQRGRGAADIKVYYADTVSSITASGSQIVATDKLVTNMLTVSASGGAKIIMDIDVADLELNVNGNSVAQVTGSSRYVSIRATEKSKVDTRELTALSAEVDAATGAEVYVFSSERLVANAKTSATIFYKGEPGILKNHTARMNMGSSVLSIGK